MNVIPYTITLRPTMQEFSNFLDYVDKIEKQYGQTYGLVKVNFQEFRFRSFLLLGGVPTKT